MIIHGERLQEYRMYTYKLLSRWGSYRLTQDQLKHYFQNEPTIADS